jgi:small-conductance mechanosensitive channel
MRSFLRQNSLSIFFLALFLGALAGQSLAGFHAYNEQEIDVARLAGEKPETLTYLSYLTTPEFSRDVMENWQSEYLQFLLYILATVWLVQRGSSESKKRGEEGTESESEQKIGRFAKPDSPAAASIGGLITKLYSNSLLLLMGLIFLASWTAQSITGWSAYNLEQSSFGDARISWTGYLVSADFWERTLQNWQSEFLAVGSMAVFAIYLRQRGSPESKPVGASHESTGIEG